MTIMSRKLTRRQVITLGIGLAALPVLNACSTAAPPPQPTATTASQPTSAAPGAATPTPSSAGFDWMRHKGKSLVVVVPQAPYQQVLQNLVPEFEEKTGISVEFQQIPEQQARQKFPIELNAKSSAIDVYGSSLHVEKLMFARAGWYEPLNDYIDNPELTPPDFNWAGFGPSGTDWVTLDDGTIIGAPGSLGLFAFMYRKDLYQEKSLGLPATLDDLQKAIEATHNPPVVYGFVGRGLKNANVPLWGMFLHAMGGDYLDPSGKELKTTSDEAVESARMYAEIMAKYAPMGAIGFNWNEAQGSFSQGQAACWPDGLNFAAPLEDPTKSQVAGKVGYGLFPGTDKQKPFAGTAIDALAINPFGRNKEAAWLFVAWASSEPVQLQMTIKGAMNSTRTAIYENREFLDAVTLPLEWVDAVKGAIQSGLPQLPLIKDVTQFRDIFGVALTKMIEGGDPKTLLEQATAEFAPILAKSLEG